MIKIIFLLFFLFSTSIGFTESSEDTYTIEQACILPPGNHMGRISSLEKNSQFQSIIIDNQYLMGSFQIKSLPGEDRNLLFFTVNSISETTQNSYRHAELFGVVCSKIGYSPFNLGNIPIRRYYENSQYHPAIEAIYGVHSVLLEDYESINGKSYRVSRILPSNADTFITITNDNLRSIKVIKTFIKNQPFFWKIINYKEILKKNGGIDKFIILEVRLSPTVKRNFTIKM